MKTPPPPPQNYVNRSLYHHDNLPVLRGMNSGTIDLIATDPPFNKGKDFHATPDSLAAGASFQDRWSWDVDVHQEWVDQLEDDWPDVLHVIEGSRKSYGNDMGAFLCFMGVRLLEMRRVLKEDGSIYLHCDPTASHYLKELMDAIFGRENFRNEIVWCYAPSGRAPKYGFHRKHDILLYYSKGPAPVFFHQYTSMNPQTLKTYNQIDADGRQYKESPGGRSYLDEQHGRPIPSWWTDIPSFGSATNSPERTGYPTQKPLALYERIIKASSNPGDWVLDPFAGCATTCVAAERLGRKWVGVDIWEKAHELVINRLQRQGLLTGPDGNEERLLSFGDITYTKEPPERTDEGEETVPYLRTITRRVEAPWARLPRTVMTGVLAEAQAVDVLTQAPAEDKRVVCAGCGRKLEREFMQLDHKAPRRDGGPNHILNRILLCGPCNRRKGSKWTLSGLVDENVQDGWMVDKVAAESAHTRAQVEAERIQHLGSDELAALRARFEGAEGG